MKISVSQQFFIRLKRSFKVTPQEKGDSENE